MANVALKPTPVVSVFSDQCLRTIIISIMAYWGLLAVVLPVSNIDSHVYNLGRLAVAENAGFWQKDAWNSPRQVTFSLDLRCGPLSLPEDRLGERPAELSLFLGLVVIVFKLVSRRWGTNVGLWSVLSLLAMPTIMIQATTTKNDLAVVFGVGCWLYSLVRFRDSQSKFFIFTAALSLAFMAGSKTYAVPICGILTVVTVWIWRKEIRTLLIFAGFYVPCFVLFGSIETYVLSWQIYHRPLGPVDFVHDQRNRDGLRGLSANFIRYYLANVSLGMDGYANQSGLAKFFRKQMPKDSALLALEERGLCFSPLF